MGGVVAWYTGYTGLSRPDYNRTKWAEKEGGGGQVPLELFLEHQIHNVTVTITTGRLEIVLANCLTIYHITT